MADIMTSTVTWVQTQSEWVKAVASLLIAFVAIGVIIVIWQKPAPTVSSAVVETASNQTLEVQSGDAAAVQADSNSGQVFTNQGSDVSGSGNVSSVQQVGGVTAGVYFAAPATEAEREMHLTRLVTTLSDFGSYPNRQRQVEGLTLLEEMSASKLPLYLYGTLKDFYNVTIRAVPGMGDALLSFKNDYYAFYDDELDFENRTATRIGSMVEGRMPAAWGLYLRYCLGRGSGHSLEQMKQGGFLLNYGITWEDAERVYSELAADQSFAKELERNVEHLADVQRRAKELQIGIKNAGW